MAIKIIAIDIDRTLLTSYLKISPKNVETIKAATAAGIKVVLCTGRPLSGVIKYLTQLGLYDLDDQYVVNYNGAILQTTSGHILESNPLLFADYLEIENLARQLNVHFQIESDTHIYTANRDISPYTVHESSLVGMPIRVRDVHEMDEDLLIAKAMMVDEPVLLDKICDEHLIPAHFEEKYYVVHSEPIYLEFMNKNANKGNAIAGLARDLGFTSENVMAIGDQANDLPMIKYAGTSIAMGNAIDQVKSLATKTTKTNDDDGVAFAIEHWALHPND